jgi:hypothetical protein
VEWRPASLIDQRCPSKKGVADHSAVLKDPLSWSDRDRDDYRSRWLDRQSADREIGRSTGPAMAVLSSITMPRSGMRDS